MAQFYFNSTAAGGTNDGNFGDGSNFWLDAAWTVPAGAPSSSDDVELNDDVQLMTPAATCHNITTSNGAAYNLSFSGGSGLTVGGTITGIIINVGSGAQIVGPGNVIHCSNCNFTSDPNPSSGAGTLIVTTSSCIFAASIVEDITDAGGTFNSGTYSGTVTGTVSVMNTGVNFNGPVITHGNTYLNSIYNSTLNVDNVGGNPQFGTSCVINGMTVATGLLIYGGTMGTGAYGSRFINCTFQGGTWYPIYIEGDVVAGVNFTSTLTFSGPVTAANIKTITIGQYLVISSAGLNIQGAFINPDYLEIGQHTNVVNSTNGLPGTMLIPATDKVKTGVAYGPSSSLTGTLTPGGGTVGYFG